MSQTETDWVKLAGTLTKPIVKLIDVASSGIGALGQPLLVILNAHADGKAKLIRQGYDHRLKKLKARHQAELRAAAPAKQVPALPTNTELGPHEVEVVFDDAEATEAIAAAVLDSEQQAKRRANVVTIVAEAADQIGDEVSDEPVDADWIARFFSYAQDVSTEQLQTLWGKLLAGEVERPGFVPLRTLETLRNMTRAEAEIFRALAARATTDGLYLHHGSAALRHQDMLILQDAGLLQPNEQIVQWLLDEEAAAEAKAANRPRSPIQEPPGKRDIIFPSGHTLTVKTPDAGYKLGVRLLRPSALPLMTILQQATDVAYLEALVDGLNAYSYFRASLSRPSP